MSRSPTGRRAAKQKPKPKPPDREARPSTAPELPPLAELFSACFADYAVPMPMDAGALREHVETNGIDLECSRVVVEERPAAFALIARRAEPGCVGGIGTMPSHRRRALGAQALVAGIEAARDRGCRSMWLKVIDSNRAAVQVYGQRAANRRGGRSVGRRRPARGNRRPAGPTPRQGSGRRGFTARASLTRGQSHRHAPNGATAAPMVISTPRRHSKRPCCQCISAWGLICNVARSTTAGGWPGWSTPMNSATMSLPARDRIFM